MKKFFHVRPLLLTAILFCMAARIDAADLDVSKPADALPKIHRTVALQFPVRMLRDGVKHGETRILLRVDNEGRLDDSLVLAYTHSSFADEALRTVKQWSFEPARVRGESVSAVVDLSVIFDINHVIAVERPMIPLGTGPQLKGEDVYQPHGLQLLDTIPVLKQRIEPVYPQEWIAKGLAEKITVDFYIDETGQARMPTVVVGENPLLRASAVAAVQQWRFEPPTYEGKPVLAHVQQIFNFSPPAAP